MCIYQILLLIPGLAKRTCSEFQGPGKGWQISGRSPEFATKRSCTHLSAANRKYLIYNGCSRNRSGSMDTRGAFGTQRPEVRILSPRPNFPSKFSNLALLL